MAEKKPTLLQQAEIELKRRNLSRTKSEFDEKIPFVKQVNKLLPNIKFKPKQEQYINARQFITWYLGGYKSGKTYCGIAKDIWLAFINRPYPGILVHQTADGLDITILPLIDEICEENHIEYTLKKLSTKYIVTFKFGLKKNEWGKLILASGDRPKSLKGPKLAFAHVDEPLIQDEEITDVIMSRLAESKAKFRQVQFTGTPEPEHMRWGFDIVDKEFEDTKDRFITTVSSREIKEHLPANYIENLEANLSPEKILVFIDGKYQNLSQGKVYTSFNSKENMLDIINDYRRLTGILDSADDKEIVLSFDFNVNQMSAVMIILAGHYKIQREEFRIKGRSDTDELTRLAITRMTESGWLVKSKQLLENIGIKSNTEELTSCYGKGIIVTGDASGKAGSTKSKKSDYGIIIDVLVEMKINFIPYVPNVNPDVRDRHNYVNKQFSNQSFLITTNCKETKRDRELTCYKLGAEGFVVDKSKKELTHLADAGDYGIYNTQMLTESESDGNAMDVGYRKKR